MTDYPEGARLRVAFDVTVIGGGGWQTMPGHHYIGTDMRRIAVSVERLPDPEPDWQHGDVVRAANGRTYARNDNSRRPTWHMIGYPPGAVVSYADDVIPRPLTPLVRGGKPWGEQ